MSHKLFTGIEIEGPFKGKVTLFVEGKPAGFTAPEVLGTIRAKLTTLNIEHVYFGANYKKFTSVPSAVQFDLIHNLASKLPNTPITIEIPYSLEAIKDANIDHWDTLHLVIVIVSVHKILSVLRYFRTSPAAIRRRVSVKLVTEDDVWVLPIDTAECTLRSSYTLLNDTLIDAGGDN